MFLQVSCFVRNCKNAETYGRKHISPANEIENIESVEKQYACISTNRSIYFINMEPRGYLHEILRN